MTTHETNDVLDAGLEAWEALVSRMKDRGLDADLASSVLAVAVAGAMTAEGIGPEQFLEIIAQTLRLWRMSPSAEGPVLVFSRPLRPHPTPSTPLEETGN